VAGVRVTIDETSSVGVRDGVTVGVLDDRGVFVVILRVGVMVRVYAGVAVEVIVGDSGEEKFSVVELHAGKINRIRKMKPRVLFIDAGSFVGAILVRVKKMCQQGTCWHVMKS
jgi:hypothetical protein